MSGCMGFGAPDGQRLRETVAPVISEALQESRSEAERGRLLAQVEEERQRLYDVLDVMPGYVCLIDQNHEYRYMNRVFTELFGQPEPGQKCYQVAVGRDTPCPNCRAFEPLVDGEPVEYDWQKSDGTILHIWNFRFVDHDGAVLSLETGINVTEARHAQVELEHLTGELRRQRDELETQVKARTADIRQLSAELALAEQRERQRLATGLHDDVSQSLAYAKMMLGALRTASSGPQMQDAAARVEQVLDETITRTRELMNDLSTPLLYEHGIVEAVSWSAAATRERHDLPVELQVTGNVVRLPQDIEITVYQAVKELINNVVKHASSPRLDIEIAFSGGWLRVTVADQGRGFNLEETRPHLSGGFGLRNIRERLAYIGGELTVETSAGNGTRCTITIPTEASPDTLQESMK